MNAATRYLKILSRLRPVVQPLFLICMIWMAVSFLLFYPGTWLMRSVPPIQAWILPTAMFVSILTASFITLIFMTGPARILEENLWLRLVLLALTLLFPVGRYWLVRVTGTSGPVLSCLGSANLFVFACLIGTWMAMAIKRPSELVPVCMVVALADLFSVFSGPTKQLAAGIEAYYAEGMQGPPPVADFLLVKFALPGTETLVPVFGISDWIVIVFLSATAAKFRLNDNLAGKSVAAMTETARFSAYFPVTAAGLLAAIAAAHTTHRFLPALPFISLVFIGFMLIRYPRVRQLEKKEWQLMVIFSAVMIGMLLAGYLS